MSAINSEILEACTYSNSNSSAVLNLKKVGVLIIRYEHIHKGDRYFPTYFNITVCDALALINEMKGDDY